MTKQGPPSCAGVWCVALLACAAAQAQDNVVQARRHPLHHQLQHRASRVPACRRGRRRDRRRHHADPGLRTHADSQHRHRAGGGQAAAHQVQATGSVAFLGDNVLSAKNVAPTVLVNYYFGAPSTRLAALRGRRHQLHQVHQRQVEPGPEGQMSDSFGAAIQAGVNYAFNKQTGLFASVAMVDVKSDLGRRRQHGADDLDRLQARHLLDGRLKALHAQRSDVSRLRRDAAQ
jgi:hypothetical protein